MTIKKKVKNVIALMAAATMCFSTMSGHASAAGLTCDAPDLFTFDVELEEVTTATAPAKSESKIKLNKTSLTMTEGSAKTLKVTGTKNKVVWSSSDTKVCTVNQNGKVKAKKAGTARICAKVGGKKLYCKVKVTKPTKADVSTYSAKPSYDTPASGSETDKDNVSIRIKVVDNGDGTRKYIIIPESDNSSYQTDNSDLTGTYAEQILKLVNEERAKEGAPALVLDDELCRAAQVRAEEAGKVFSHTRPDGRICFSILTDMNIHATNWGENLAQGSSTSSGAMKQWMNSPGHRSNILDTDWRKIGVGYDSTTNTWSQLFTN